MAGGELTGFDVRLGLERVGLGGSSPAPHRAGVGDKRVRQGRRKRHGKKKVEKGEKDGRNGGK